MPTNPSYEALKKRVAELERQVEQLQITTNKFQTIFNLFPHSIIVSDANGNIIDANAAAEQLLGIGKQNHETKNSAAAKIFAESNSTQRGDGIQALLEKGNTWSGQHTLYHRNGTPIFVHSTMTPIFGDKGELNYVIAISYAIAEQKRAETLLKESEKKYRQLFTEMVSGAGLYEIICDKTGKPIDFLTLEVNRAFESLVGIKKEQVVGKTFREISSAADKDIWIEKFGEVALTGKSVSYKRYASANKQYFEGTAYSPQPGQFAITFTDVTERVSAREKIESQAKSLDTIFNSAPNILLLVNDKGRVEKINHKGIDFSGRKTNEVIGLLGGEVLKCQNSFGEKICGSNTVCDDCPIKTKVGDTLNTGTPHIEEEGQMTVLIDGQAKQLDLLISTKLLESEAAKRVLVSITDVTKLKATEKVLKASQSNLMALIENADDVMVLRDVEGKAIVYNEAFAKTVKRLFNIEAKPGIRTMDFLPEKEKMYWEKVLAKVQTGISQRKEYEWEIDGQIRYFYTSHNPIRVGNQIIGTAEITRDITERKEMAARIQQSQKMEAIGNLAGGIAHDFNNLLFPIVGMAELLMEDLPYGSAEHENAQEIYNAGRRGSDLVKQILAFSRQTEHKMIPIHIQQILQEILKLIRATIPSYIEISEDIQPDCGLIFADPTQIHQVAMNIITNAFHAVESKGGKITIRIKEVDTKADLLIEEPLANKRYVLLSISDTGCGIPSNIRDKIFEPYFTTKAQGKGTGLGLAVVYGIIKEHKGDIKVYSEAGKGTTFNIYLPIMAEGKEENKNKILKSDPRGNEHILVVDDEASIVRLEQQMIERLGYQVTACVSSTEALKLFKADCELFDLVISDMTMPIMTGDQLARELIAIRADIPIILCTGFSERVNQENAADFGVKGFLMKPIVKSEIAKIIRELLDASKGDRQP